MKASESHGGSVSSRLLAACGIHLEESASMRYPRGRLVEDRIGETPGVVLVRSGNVDVYSVSMDGNEVLLTTLSQGDMFGISNLFDDDELRTVLQCRTECELLFIRKAVLRDALLRHPEAMAAYARLCNKKTQFLIRRIEQLSLNSSRAKLAGFLLASSEDGGEELFVATKESLSLRLGISRAALYRELSSLQEVGAIRTEGTQLVIVDREKLEECLQL